MKHFRRSRASARGLTLVELLVSLVIGLVVIGAVLSTYLASGVSGRHGTALAQMTEDATVAINILRSQIAMAGFSQPYDVDTATGQLKRSYAGSAVIGCEGGFVDHKVALDTLKCKGGKGPDAIAVAYEADTGNTLPLSTGDPSDCLGQALPSVAAASPVPGYSLADNRFFLSSASEGAPPELYCLGNGGKSVPAPG